jgi:homoserine kinase type II
MSVFTSLSLDEVRASLREFAIGEIVELRGIAAGITNTNYFVMTAETRYVLTIFEKNTAEELPYFVDLMTHLAAHGVLCPTPICNKQGIALHAMKGKPALMVNCLAGQDVATPNLMQVREVALMLAKMHVAGDTFKATGVNQRDQAWFVETMQKVLPKLAEREKELLQQELAYQQAFDTSHLPHGVIHGDLFRDNVLFDGDKMGGFIDFYYACHDVLLYDVAIAVNEWCMHHNGSELGTIDAQKVDTFLSSYQSIRPLNAAELAAWHPMLRRAALRFWLSRLYDFYYPADGELTHAKDPNHFKHLLQTYLVQEK